VVNDWRRFGVSPWKRNYRVGIEPKRDSSIMRFVSRHCRRVQLILAGQLKHVEYRCGRPCSGWWRCAACKLLG